jgi:hypothetical protein
MGDGALDSKAANEVREVGNKSESVRRERWIENSDDSRQRYEHLLTGEIADSLPLAGFASGSESSCRKQRREKTDRNRATY